MNPTLCFPAQGSQCRSLEAETQAEAMKECCWAYRLTVLHGLLSLPSYRTKGTSPKVPLPTVSWTFPQQSSKCTTSLSTGQSGGGGIFSIEVLFSSFCQGDIKPKLHKKLQDQRPAHKSLSPAPTHKYTNGRAGGGGCRDRERDVEGAEITETAFCFPLPIYS